MGLMPAEVVSFRDAAAITKSDSVPNNFDAIYVGVTGNVAVMMLSGAVVTFTAIPAGAVLRVKVSKVMSTSTTATDMIGLRY